MSNNDRRSRSRASSKREETVLRKLLLFLLLSEKTVLARVRGGLALLVVPFFLTGLGMTKKSYMRNIQKHPGRLFRTSSSQLRATSPISKMSRKKLHGERHCQDDERRFP